MNYPTPQLCGISDLDAEYNKELERYAALVKEKKEIGELETYLQPSCAFLSKLESAVALSITLPPCHIYYHDSVDLSSSKFTASTSSLILFKISSLTTLTR